MPHYMRHKNFNRHMVALQQATESGEVRVTTEEAGAVIARYRDNKNVVLFYNLYAETVQVLLYDNLTPLAVYETNQPLVLAAALAK